MTMIPEVYTSSIPNLSVILDKLKRDTSLNIYPFKPVQLWKTLLNQVVELRRTDNTSVFLKIAKDDESLLDEYERTNYFDCLFRDAPPEFRTVKVLACCENPIYIVIEGANGKSFHEMVRNSCSWSLARNELADTLTAASAIGRWLRYLETASVGDSPAQTVWDKLLTDSAEVRAKFSAKKWSSSVDSMIERCIGVIEDTARSGLNPQVYRSHHDFHPENIFVDIHSQFRVTTIDCRLSEPSFIGYDSILFGYHLHHSY